MNYFDMADEIERLKAENKQLKKDINHIYCRTIYKIQRDKREF